MNAITPPIYHPGALPTALRTHRLAILASIPAAVVPAAIAGLTFAPLYLIQPVLVAILILLFLSIGILTAIPTRMILRTTPNYDLDGWIAVPFAVAFPVWGGIITLLSMGLLAPITCSAAWCFALGHCLGFRRGFQLWIVLAFAPMLVAGAVALLLMVISEPHPLVIGGALLASWLAIHPIALALATELRKRDLALFRGWCRTCGYPREGLAPGAPCPECGHA